MSVSHVRRSSEATDLAELAELTELVDLAAGELGGLNPALVLGASSEQPGEITLSVIPLTGPPPIALRGLEAPQRWSHAAIVHRHLGHRICHVVDRSGMSATLRRRTSGAGAESLGTHPDQRVDDALRRALRLPTPPPPRSAAELLTTWWLDRVVQTALLADPGERLNWAQIAALGHLPRSPSTRRGELTHSELRAALEPRHAHWFDDGSFARHLLAWLPEREELLADLAVLLPAAIYERLDAAVG